MSNIEDITIEVRSDKNVALVIDDEIMNAFIMRQQVEALGLGCDSTINSTLALILVKERVDKAILGKALPYTLLLIDYSMPNIDGIELVKAARQIYAQNGLPQPLYCCCTAYASEQHR